MLLSDLVKRVHVYDRGPERVRTVKEKMQLAGYEAISEIALAVCRTDVRYPHGQRGPWFWSRQGKAPNPWRLAHVEKPYGYDVAIARTLVRICEMARIGGVDLREERRPIVELVQPSHHRTHACALVMQKILDMRIDPGKLERSLLDCARFTCRWAGDTAGIDFPRMLGIVLAYDKAMVGIIPAHEDHP